MTLDDFGRFMQTKSVGRVEAPVNEQLTERVFTAMKRIANLTIPLKWCVDDPEGYEILRRPDEYTYIRFPDKPILNSGQNLDIEDELLDALALFVMAGLEMQRSKVLMGMFYAEIDAYNDKLMSTYLVEATNDSAKFYQFP